MKILADENIPFVREAFAQFGDVLAMPGRHIGHKEVSDVDVLLVRSITPVNRQLLDGAPVKFVGSATIGTDHVDIDYLKGRGIGFTAAPGSNARSVAEYVVAALLTLSEKNRFPLSGKTIGIIGVGNVGSRVAALSDALGMKCLLNDPPKARTGNGYGFCEISDLLAQADIVTLHVPLTTSGHDATVRMANERFFKAMKPGAIFINTSRGAVVNEPALVKNRARLGAVVLDVWDNEPSIGDETLAAADIATPHIAGYSFNGKVRGTEMMYEAVCDFFGKQKTWTAQTAFANIERVLIDVRSSDNPLWEAVTAAYPIMVDDANMRRIASEREPGRYFDALRKNYPRRLEFSHFNVQCAAEQKKEAAALESIGFNVTAGSSRSKK